MQTFEIKQENNLFKLYRIENGKEGCICSFLDLESAENKKVYYEYVAKCGSIFQEGLELTKKLLREHNATKDRPLEFDVFVDAPSIVSTDFDDDVADCYISKLYIDGEDIFADLYAYYIGDDRTNIHLNKEYNTNWAEIITYLI